jgi:hypothetical protein
VVVLASSYEHLYIFYKILIDFLMVNQILIVDQYDLSEMRLQVSSYIWVSVFFLILLGYFVTVSSFDVQGSTDCSRQTSSPVDCPPSSSEKGTENDDDDDSGNIEEQIPSVLPFP